MSFCRVQAWIPRKTICLRQLQTSVRSLAELKSQPWSFQTDSAPSTPTRVRSPLSISNDGMVSALRSGFPNACFEIALRMKTRNIQPDITTYTQLISAAAKESRTEEAWSIFEDLIVSGIPPTVKVFNQLLKAHLLHPPDHIWEVIDRMHSLKVEPDSETYNMIIHFFAAAGNLELCLKYYQVMKTSSLKISLPAISNIISLAAGQGYPRLALDLLQAYEEGSVRQVEPEVWMKCLAASAEMLWAEGVQISWDLLVENLRLTPDEGICNSVFNTAARHGIPVLAMQTLACLDRAEIPIEEHHLAAVIEAYARSGDLTGASLALKSFMSPSFQPTLKTVLPMSRLISQNVPTFDLAWSMYLDKFVEEEADLLIMNMLLQATVFLRDVNRAQAVYATRTELAWSPNIDTFNLMIHCAIAAKHHPVGDLMMQDMQKAGVTPNQDTYCSMISLCLTQSDYQDAFLYLEQLKAEGIRPPREIYQAIIEKCANNGDSRYSLALEEMEEVGYNIESDFKRSVLQAFDRANASPPPSTSHGQEQGPQTTRQ